MRDPSMEQTAAGLSTTSGIDTQLIATSREREVLRSLAAKVLEHSARPEEDEKRKLWTNHNDLD
jgi:ribulose 1,5-bisphosphate carboxylase large subunit-like protein